MSDYSVEIQNLSFSYIKNRDVLSKISISVKKGETIALLGRNGCGKSTLIKCIMNFLKPHNGTILIDGRNSTSYSVREFARRVAYVSQNYFGNEDCNLKDFLLLGRSPFISAFAMPKKEDHEIVNEYAAQCQITKLLDTPIKHLSGGQRQIAVIARALIQQSDIIIMDEPSAALDLSNQVLLLNMMRKVISLGKTVLYSTHDPNHALVLGSTVCLLHNGAVYDYGHADSVITQQSITEIYGRGILVEKLNESTYCRFSIDQSSIQTNK